MVSSTEPPAASSLEVALPYGSALRSPEKMRCGNWERTQMSTAWWFQPNGWLIMVNNGE